MRPTEEGTLNSPSVVRAGVAKDDRLVTVVREPGLSSYTSDNPEFNPSEQYPEYQGPLSRTGNPVYSLLRRLLMESGLDLGRQNTAEWNPLGDLIQPGARVLVKPNLVYHEAGAGSLDSLVTHASLIRAVLDYVLRARPSRIVVADSPLLICDFDRLIQVTGLERVASYYARQHHPVEWLDLRCTPISRPPVQEKRPHDVSGDPRSVAYDLQNESLLDPISSTPTRFNVGVYDPESHRPGTHRYLMAREVIETDVVISLPKLKTHKRAGLTGALKITVGTSGHKELLPHHRMGGSARSGDCYRGHSYFKDLAERIQYSGNRIPTGRATRLLAFKAQTCIRLARLFGSDATFDGSWSGNDTIWRTCLDLNRILLYGKPDGTLSDVPQRTLLYVTDAIIAGEGEGPLAPTPKPLGLLSLGLNPAAVDYVHAFLMGLDWRRIPIVRGAFGDFAHPLVDFTPEQVHLTLNGKAVEQPWPAGMMTRFLPPSGWRGQCELG